MGNSNHDREENQRRRSSTRLLKATAGIFSVRRFEEAGRGVDKNESQKKRFFLYWDIVIRKFWKLIPLSLLFTALCIPIITIGPAIAGLTYVLRNISQEEPIFVLDNFFDAFKKNFKQSFGMSIINLIIIVIGGYSIYYWVSVLPKENPGIANFLPIVIGICVMFVWAQMNYYIHLMIVSLTLSLKQIIKNSFILTLVSKKLIITNVITSLIIALIVYPLAINPSLLYIVIPIMIFVGFAMLGLVICFNSYQYILEYVVKPFYDKQKADGTYVEEEKIEAIFEDIGSKETSYEQERPKRTSIPRTLSDNNTKKSRENKTIS